jgi:hypothetical protein
MAGIATLASTVGAPITHTYKLDDANSTTGLLLNFKNDSGLTCLIRVGYYIVTQAASGQEMETGVTTTSAEKSKSITDSGTATTGTVYWSDGNDVIADGSYLTMYNVSTDTATVATSLVGYAVVELWPVCAVV